MPLLDHFHPPLAPRRHWESFQVNWAGAIADSLNETLLPEGYFAEEHAQLGPCVEIDVATFTESECGPTTGCPTRFRHCLEGREHNTSSGRRGVSLRPAIGTGRAGGW